ncbi:unnamed protein product [Cuscuta europaea]|uniref:Uncharacterized protein n=1 Tax=Cuscuta europaea TaxID=41803 RepID=A0A9P1EAN3_CUSEU|nr:unnamed protein product [Cuscuta europaea]
MIIAHNSNVGDFYSFMIQIEVRWLGTMLYIEFEKLGMRFGGRFTVGRKFTFLDISDIFPATSGLGTKIKICKGGHREQTHLLIFLV